MRKYINPSIIVLSLVVSTSIIGCRATKVVEVPRIKTVNVDRYVHDSIHTIDSIIVPFIYCPDDTIPFAETDQSKYPKQIEKHYEVKYNTTKKDSIVIDTIYITKDVPYPVEKDLSWIQETQIYIGDAFIVGLLLFVLIKYRKVIFGLITKLI